MQYLLMCHFNEAEWEAIPEAKRDAIMETYHQVMDDLTESGRYLSGAKLEPTSAATSVRIEGERQTVTDGPFVETKEHLGGYHLIECDDLDAAVEIARRIPTLPSGGAVEVRPLAPREERVEA